MSLPRLTIVLALIPLLSVVALAGPASEPAERANSACTARPADAVKPGHVLPPDDEEEEGPKVPAFVQAGLRRVQLLLLTMAGAPARFDTSPTPATPRYPPSDQPIPIVVKPPTPPVDTAGPPIDGRPTPAATPEPASLATGLVGAGLALASWVRRRRRGKPGKPAPSGRISAKREFGERLPLPI